MSVAEQSTGLIAQHLAERLDAAWRSKNPIGPISESDNITNVSIAYDIQARWTDLRLSRGERIAGRKIGLTSSGYSPAARSERAGLWDPVAIKLL